MNQSINSGQSIMEGLDRNDRKTQIAVVTMGVSSERIISCFQMVTIKVGFLM